jgi:putative FmdB family regulatory protein
MPIYEYGCMKCGKKHEIMQKFSDAPMTSCPDCGGEVRKMVSNTSFVLKGTGWYATDYASNKTGESGNKTTSDKAGTKTGNKPEESKAEVKAEAKKEEVAAK